MAAIYTPENSFIQLTHVGYDAYVQDCVDIMQNCLPAMLGTDIRFQIVFEDMEEPFATYLLKIEDADGNVVTLNVSDGPSTEIFAYLNLTEHEGFAVGTFNPPTLDFNDSLVAGECFTICLYKQTNIYTYTGPFETYPDDTVIEITVNGIEVVSLSFMANNQQDIADKLQEVADALGDGDTVTSNAETNTITIASDVNEYELLVVIAASSEEFNPVVTEEHEKTHCSNCFKVIDDPCFTSVLKYRGNEDQFSFYYALVTQFYNQVRVYVYMDNPQPIFDENYFVRSDGSKKVLSARYEKEYDVHTEYFDESRHFQLIAAIKHDVLLVGESAPLAREFTAEGKYDIGWLNKPGLNLDSAPASFKVRPTPFFQMNSNCE